jgi:ATP-dependent Clp protease, protease subunit
MRHSELRYPGDPRPDEPPSPPPPPDNAPWLDEQLFSRRMVFLRGRLEQVTATRTAATLLALDAQSEDPVRLHISAEDGELDSMFALVDAMDAMRSPISAVAVGIVGGAALGVFCAAGSRSAFAHARFRLAEPKVQSRGGTADQVVAEAGRYLRDLEDLVLRIVAATGQPRSRVEDDLAANRVLTAPEALEYGLIGEIVSGRSES